MGLSIFGNVIWDSKWQRDKKIGVAVTVASMFSILVVVLIFVTFIIIETKHKLTSIEPDIDADSPSSSAFKGGEYRKFCDSIQRSAKVGAPGLVSFITAVAFHSAPACLQHSRNLVH